MLDEVASRKTLMHARTSLCTAAGETSCLIPVPHSLTHIERVTGRVMHGKILYNYHEVFVEYPPLTLKSETLVAKT